MTDDTLLRAPRLILLVGLAFTAMTLIILPFGGGSQAMLTGVFFLVVLLIPLAFGVLLYALRRQQ